ncbi:MAG: hypothetical protein IT582_11575 [Opitutaceae bacterium]|nr:hypothetical protein [Opitutaceae bacterium]
MPFAERRIIWGLSVRAWVGVAATLGGVVWLVWFLLGLGPQKVGEPFVTVEMNGAQWRVAHEIDEIERRYREVGAEAAEDLERQLAHAIDLQEQLIKAGAGVGSEQALRLERLTAARDTLRARMLWPRVTELEGELKVTVEPAARELQVAELLALRRGINRSQAEARYKDLARETQLERDYESQRAGPLREQADAEHRLAQKAATAEQWAEALAHYTRARELMDEVNQNFARTKYADLALRARLFAEETSLLGAAEAAEVAVWSKGALEAEADRPEVAAEYWQRAADLQERLNQRWPKSRFFSTSQLRRILESKQALLAKGVLARIQSADIEVTRALAARRIVAARSRIDEVLARLQSPEVRSGAAPGESAGLERKYRLLESLGDTLREVQDEAYAQFAPLPGWSGVLLMRGEVTQDFYVKIMKFNPSREPGERRAVDSVTWSEAAEFCKRLGWVLGHRARLPTADEYQAALQSPGDFLALRDGRAEWLDVSGETAETRVWPADGSDRAGPRNRESRARDTSFRVVLQTDGDMD